MVYANTINTLTSITDSASISTNDIQTTKEVMREEVELLVKKERTIFTILSIATLVTIIITIKIVQK